MKTKFRLILAALAALFLCSCAGQSLVVRTPLGNARIGVAGGGQGHGPNGPPQRYAENGHSGPPGVQRRLVKGNGDYYSKTHWNNSYRPQVQIQVNGRPLDASDEELKTQIENWAIEQFKASGHKSPPTNQQATAYAESIRGQGQVRVRLGNSRPDPTMVSRKRVNESEVPAESRADFQRRAIEQFNKTGKNTMITDGRFYPN